MTTEPGDSSKPSEPTEPPADSPGDAPEATQEPAPADAVVHAAPDAVSDCATGAESPPVPTDEGREAASPEAQSEEPPPTPEQRRIAELEAEVSTLRAKWEETTARLRAVSKAYTDQKEEMASFRQRTEERGRSAEERRAFDLVKTFFDPVQNLKRSLQQGGIENAALLEGLQLILKQFVDGLVKLGLQEVPGEGAPFDPAVHEALAVMPVPDAKSDGKVMMVHSTGYAVGGKVLQAAQVVVGKYTEEPAAEA